jgi:hypothetical protein
MGPREHLAGQHARAFEEVGVWVPIPGVHPHQVLEPGKPLPNERAMDLGVVRLDVVHPQAVACAMLFMAAFWLVLVEPSARH